MNSLHIQHITLKDTALTEQWEAYVRRRDSSLGYGLPVWLRIIQDAFGHTPYPLAAVRGGDIVGILPLVHVRSSLFGSRLVSLPFVNYGGILADDLTAAQGLADAARDLGQNIGVKNTELRHCAPSGLALPVKAGHKTSMILDLPPTAEALWKHFKDKVRNQVRKAQKSGLVIQKGRKELLNDFYRVFCRNMRDLGTPVYAKSFFAAVLERLPHETEILCVRQGALCIAAGILYAYGDTMQMPWASSLSSRRDNCPNHLLYWSALKHSTDAGFARFDFGRSTPGSGPWRFKKQWGTRELPLHWEFILLQGEELTELSVNNPKFRMAIAAWKKLPLFVANFLGPKIVRGIP